MVTLGRSHVEMYRSGRRIASFAEDPVALGPGSSPTPQHGPSLGNDGEGINCSCSRVGILAYLESLPVNACVGVDHQN